MKLAHYDFECVFDLSAYINVLVIEDEEQFFRYCMELNGQIQGEEGNFCLSEGENILSLSKYAAFIADYFSLQVNDKKFTNKLYQSLQGIAEEHFLKEYQQISSLIADFFAKLNSESDCAIEYEETNSVSCLFKAFDVRIEEEGDLLEKILLFIRVHAEFLKVKCFFFVNLKTFLSEKSLLSLYHECELADICIFLLENIPKNKLEGERITIIDRDLCEILA